MTYDAFISYSHGDDAAVAEAVQDGLQRLARPWYRRRALHVFRDSTGLSANPGLWSSIVDVIADTNYLVVMCSPAAAASIWVGREIEHWRSAKPAGHVLLVLAGGELVWDNARGDFDAARSTALNPALAGAFIEEPLYVDMRWANRETHLTLRDPRFNSVIADLAAPMHGVAKDDIVGEDIRQHRRALRIAGASAAAIALLSIAVMIVALKELNTANQKAHLKISLDAARKELKATNAKVAAANHKLDGVNAALTRATVELASSKKLLTTADRKKAAAQAASRRANRARLLSVLGKNDALGRLAVAQRNVENAAFQVFLLDLSQNDISRRLASARRDLGVAIKAKDAATRAKNAADLRSRLADAHALSTRLAAASESPGLADSHLDLALLLAVAATQAPDPAGQAATPAAQVAASSTATFAPRATPAGSPYGALLEANTHAAGVHGFLHFGPGGNAHALGSVAVSPDGKFVAAAETSDRIQVGESRNSTHVFFWHANDPTRTRARRLPATFDCISDLRWLADGELITVENVPGPGADDCTPKLLYKTSQGVSYGATKVQLWDMNKSPLTPVDPSQAFGLGHLNGDSLRSIASPVSVSPDGHVAMMSFDTGVRRPDGSGIVISLLANTSGQIDTMLAEPLHLFLGQTFSPSSHFAVGFDEGSGEPVVWNLGVFKPPSECTGPQYLHPAGCFGAVSPAGGNTIYQATIAPDERSFTVERSDELAIRRYDATTGALIAETPQLPSPIWGYAAGNNVVAITDSVGKHARFTHWGDATWTDVPFTSPFGCSFAPGVGVDENLLLLHQLHPDSVNCDTTLVVRTTQADKGVVRELQGFPQFTDAADHILTQQLILRTTSGVPI